jgi:hypothetical protein
MKLAHVFSITKQRILITIPFNGLRGRDILRSAAAVVGFVLWFGVIWPSGTRSNVQGPAR